MTRRRDEPRDTPWSVYLVECADGTLYCGVTNNIERRLAAHNAGKGARYTRGKAPVRLAWHETCASKSAALKREIAVKKLTRHQKLHLTNSRNTRNDSGLGS